MRANIATTDTQSARAGADTVPPDTYNIGAITAAALRRYFLITRISLKFFIYSHTGKVLI